MPSTEFKDPGGPHLRERDFLSHAEGWVSRWRWIGGTALIVALLIVVSKVLGRGGAVLGLIGLIVGIGLLWAALRWSKILAQARVSLDASPIDARLEVQVRRGYAAIPYTTGQLWPIEGANRPIAQFGTTTWCRPRFGAVDKAEAQVFGAPVKGAAVIVSCPAGVLVGRVKWSRFGDQGPGTAMPRAVYFLFKRR